jgi:HlyD family secretion protein
VRVASYVLDELEQNRTVEIEAEFADAQAATGLLPGTSADVEIILSRREGVLRVPTSAVADRSIVLVLEGGRLEERTVVAGLANWQFTEVLDGLNGGELVVTVRDSTAVQAGALAEARDR